MSKKTILVGGGGGFIGGHLVGRLLADGHKVRSVDIKPLGEWYQVSEEAENIVADLKGREACQQACAGMDDVYNLAADMGGMGFIENNKALCMLSVLINTHMLQAAQETKVKRFFYASSACVYNADKQVNEDVVPLKEEDAYPAMPEDGYGWEKLFSERMCRQYTEDYGLETRVLRFHNIYGPKGTYEGGREEALAAICRKVALAADNDEIEVSGDAQQTRSYSYVDDCVEAILRLMRSDYREPLNLGQGRMLSMDRLVDIVAELAGKNLKKRYALGKPQDTRVQKSDNSDLRKVLDWVPQIPLERGLEITYHWIYAQLKAQGRVPERSA